MSAELFELKQYKNWVAYQLEMVKGRDKPGKVPYNPMTGRGAMANNPATLRYTEQNFINIDENRYL